MYAGDNQKKLSTFEVIYWERYELDLLHVYKIQQLYKYIIYLFIHSFVNLWIYLTVPSKNFLTVTLKLYTWE